MMFQTEAYKATTKATAPAPASNQTSGRTEDFDKSIFKICTRILTSRHSHLLGQLSFVHMEPKAPSEAEKERQLIACYALFSRKSATKTGKGKKRQHLLPSQEYVGTFTAWTGTKENGAPSLTFAFRQNKACYFEKTYPLAEAFADKQLPPKNCQEITDDLRCALFETLKMNNYPTQEFPAFLGFPEPL